jgi:SNF2 family DNA or RNA helicase
MKLLLSPHKLGKDLLMIEAVELTKKAGIPQLETLEPAPSLLRDKFPQLPKEARDAVCFFSKSALISAKAEIDRSGKVTGTDPEYRKQALLKMAHGHLLTLKPFLPLCEWMHRVPLSEGRMLSGQCIFSPLRPLLHFEVQKTEGRFLLQANVELNEGKFPLNDFERYHFLLRSKNEYFLLTWKDYQLLNWLAKQPALEASAFREQVLSRVQNDYRVNSSQLLGVEKIASQPGFQVLLSEISNNFLVLTPQWNYEGFVMEGEWTAETELTRNGKTYIVVRDKDQEDPLRKLLESLHPNFERQLNGYYYLSFADAQKKQWFAKTYHLLLEKEIDVLGMDMLRHFRYSPEKIQTMLELESEEGDWLHFTMQVKFGKEIIPLQELQKMLWAGQKAVLLKDGSLGLLTDEWQTQYGQLLKHARVQKKGIRIGRWAALSGQSEEPGKLIPEGWWKNWSQWRDENATPLYSLPSLLGSVTLRPYQQKGYEWMRLLSEIHAGGCLADDMGLGKTLQTIAYLASRLEKYPEALHLVVCPSSLLYNWQQELQRFAPTIPVLLHHGPQRKAESWQTARGAILISSYGTVRSDLEHFRDIVFDSIIVDESHSIKNPASLTARAVYELQCHIRFALSGTPVMNNTFDLFGQFQFLIPGMFGSREFFKREYADPIDRQGDEEKTRALQKITAPFILRRTKEQVATDLPEKVESILWCEMGSDQRMAYDTIREQIKSNLFLQINEQGLEAGKLNVLQGILKLRMACNSCELIQDESLFNYDSVKTEVLLEELENLAVGSKALVFSQFTRMLDLLEKELQKREIAFLRLDGQTKVEDRQNRVNQFNQDANAARVFLLSLKAGNAGLNLTAADYVFLFDPWWNRAVEQQAIDRTHRIGQTRSVFAYRMLCRDSIEERILQLQQKKSRLTEELIGNEDAGFVKNLTEEDIRFLFS